MSLTRKFVQCDVFSPVPTQGNGLAVVVDSEDLSDAELQGFAAWTNLAETTFLLPPTDPSADYRVRIFTPTGEMPFAGHPTLGSCAAWLHTGGVSKESGLVRQECGVGIVDIDVTGEDYAFLAPPTSIEPLRDEDLDVITDALDIASADILRTARLDNGPVWQALHLAGADQVLAIDSSRVSWPEFRSIGLIGPHPPGSDCDYEVRMLAPSSGMSEDPITGSLNAALAHWMQRDGLLTRPVTMAQGTRINRSGRVFIRPDQASGGVFVGGATHIVIDGTVTL